jgi:alpha-L-arabinofuranosidase
MVTFFAVNRNGEEKLDVKVGLNGFKTAGASILDHQVMTHADLEAVNDLKKPNEVVPKKGKGAKVADGTLSVSLPPYSYQMLRVKL